MHQPPLLIVVEVHQAYLEVVVDVLGTSTCGGGVAAGSSTYYLHALTNWCQVLASRFTALTTSRSGAHAATGGLERADQAFPWIPSVKIQVRCGGGGGGGERREGGGGEGCAVVSRAERAGRQEPGHPSGRGGLTSPQQAGAGQGRWEPCSPPNTWVCRCTCRSRAPKRDSREARQTGVGSDGKKVDIHAPGTKPRR